MNFTFGSLFSGIGGLDLGLERAGWECGWQIEIDPFRQAVLKKNSPWHVERHGDIREVDFLQLMRVDLLAGGFPCQDLSTAGRLQGLHGPQSGLHQEFLHAIKILNPNWVLIENIWQSWRRYVPQLRRALWRLGYASVPFRVRASEVGAPHVRARILLLAHPDEEHLRQQRRRC